MSRRPPTACRDGERFHVHPRKPGEWAPESGPCFRACSWPERGCLPP
ncbi:MAG: hypothetical protein ACFFBV_15155 [Promethearchaeota archaeon]